jgi:hypothetical protein
LVHQAEVSRVWRRKVLELNQHNAEVGGGGTGRAQRWTKTELSSYGLAQLRPIVERFATTEEEMNKFVAYVVNYKTLNPTGALRHFTHPPPCVLNSRANPTPRHTLTPGASKRATEACSTARDEPPRPASLAPNADTGADGGHAVPLVLNPEGAIRSGRQQAARHKGVHEPSAKKARKEATKPRAKKTPTPAPAPAAQ